MAPGRKSICGLVVLLAACGPDPGTRPADSAAGANPLAYVDREFRKTEETCVEPGSLECARIVLQYPEIVDAPSPDVRDRINQSIRGWILSPLGDETPSDSIDGFMDGFLREYRRFKSDFPASTPVWFLERKVEVAHLSARVLSLRFEEFTFTGGAHPNTWIVYSNVRPETGDEIELNDLVGEDGRGRLEAIAEGRFRKQREIPPDASLEAAGFWFEEDRFRLNDNFSIGAAGLIFYYNRYEVAPYAMGPTEIVLAYRDIENILRPEAGIP